MNQWHANEIVNLRKRYFEHYFFNIQISKLTTEINVNYINVLWITLSLWKRLKVAEEWMQSFFRKNEFMA